MNVDGGRLQANSEDLKPKSAVHDLESKGIWRIAKLLYWLITLLLSFPIASKLADGVTNARCQLYDCPDLRSLKWLFAPLAVAAGYIIYRLAYKKLLDYLIFGGMPKEVKAQVGYTLRINKMTKSMMVS
jgi:hypothetical protein